MKRVSLKRICPVWILTTLRGDKFEKFKAEVDNQFSIFSETELDGYEDKEKHKWWDVTQVDNKLSEKWNQETGLPNCIPVLGYNGLYDGKQVEVIFHSPLSDFEKNVGYIKELRENKQFLENYINSNRLFYGVIPFRREESKRDYFIDTISYIEKISESLFESVIFHSDSSNCASNPDGYLSLDDNDFIALSANLVFATALMKVTLTTVSNQNEKRFHLAGCFNFVYEPDAFKRNSSVKLASLLMESFCNNEADSEWFNQNEAITTFENSTIKKSLHWRSVYEQLHSNFKEEKLDSVFVNPRISPWAMLAYKLRPEYFRKYLKSLLRTVYEKIHDFGALTLMRFNSFVDLRYQQLLEGSVPVENSSQFAKSAISEFLSGLWSPDNKGAKGLKQAQLLVATLKDYLVRQKEEVEKVKEWKQPSDKNFIDFPKPNDYPLQEIFDERNKQFTMHYEEEAINHPSIHDNTPDINKMREINELTIIHRIMQYHPMPLNLFVKVALLAALLPVTIWVILTVIPDYILNSTVLESGKGLTIMYLIVAAFIFIFGFVQYARNTLHKMRTGIRKYVAWYYYQIERQTYLKTLQKESDYYDEMIAECDCVETQIKLFVEVNTPEMPSYEQYRISKFQRNILQCLDNEISILKNGVVRTELNIDKEYACDIISVGLFNALIEFCDRGMGDVIMSRLLNARDDMQDSKIELMNYWSSLLADKINIYINNKDAGSDITQPAFATVGNDMSNFSDDAIRTIFATMYPSVFVPVVRSYAWSAVFLSNTNGAGRKWESLNSDNDVMRWIPDYNQEDPVGGINPTKIALFVRMHSFHSLLSKNGEIVRTIFN